MTTYIIPIALQTQMPNFFSNGSTGFYDIEVNGVTYKASIRELMSKQFLEEDIRDSSRQQHNQLIYWYAWYYATGIYWYYTKNNLSGSTGWTTIKDTFDLDTIIPKFECNGINFYQVLDVVGLPTFTVVNPGSLVYVISGAIPAGDMHLTSIVNQTTVAINHGLGRKYCDVIFSDALDDDAGRHVNYVDDDNLTVTFSIACTGTIICKR